MMLLCLLLHLNAKGQFFDSLRFLTIDFELLTSERATKNSTFSNAVSNFNFGDRLQAPPGDSLDWMGDVASARFAITFHLHNPDSAFLRHQVLFSLVNQTMTPKWYSYGQEGAETTLEGTFGFFQLGIGYTYSLLDKRFIKIRPGLRMGYSIAISGSHNEQSPVENVKYFADLRSGFSFEFPILIEIRLFGATYLKFGPSWGVGFFSFDGYKTSVPLNGGLVGLKFGL